MRRQRAEPPIRGESKGGAEDDEKRWPRGGAGTCGRGAALRRAIALGSAAALIAISLVWILGWKVGAAPATTLWSKAARLQVVHGTSSEGSTGGYVGGSRGGDRLSPPAPPERLLVGLVSGQSSKDAVNFKQQEHAAISVTPPHPGGNAAIGPQPTLSLRQMPPTATAGQIQTTPAPDGDAAMKAVLDELLELHRRDVAKRELATVAPQDQPVSFSDEALVVTMADGGYAACAIRLIESVRGAGRWGGAVTLLMPTGVGSEPLSVAAVSRLAELGATLVPVGPEVAGGAHVRGAGSAAQYAKVALLVDVAFRRYESILFLDADGIVGAPLQPLLWLPLPAGRVVAMPTWPSTQVVHESLYAREVNFGALTPDAAARLRMACPDRTLVGITAWFLLRPTRLQPPSVMRNEVDAALSSWRPAFRFNDQGLWNVLFYNTSAFYPLCLAGPPAQAGSGAREEPAFRPLVKSSTGGVGHPKGGNVDLEDLGRAIASACGSELARRRPMYVHNLKDCLPPEEWQRKLRNNLGHSFQ